eukprot:scaffold2078_cov34-Tisochrysis_lutea.AAC.2
MNYNYMFYNPRGPCLAVAALNKHQIWPFKPPPHTNSPPPFPPPVSYKYNGGEKPVALGGNTGGGDALVNVPVGSRQAWLTAHSFASDRKFQLAWFVDSCRCHVPPVLLGGRRMGAHPGRVAVTIRQAPSGCAILADERMI